MFKKLILLSVTAVFTVGTVPGGAQTYDNDELRSQIDTIGAIHNVAFAPSLAPEAHHVHRCRQHDLFDKLRVEVHTARAGGAWRLLARRRWLSTTAATRSRSMARAPRFDRTTSRYFRMLKTILAGHLS